MSDCPVCDHARMAAWWGQDGTHCGLEPSGNDCHRSWTALNESHCEVCHQHFTGDTVADLHVSYCTSDRVATAERMTAARRKDGTPVFGVTVRRSGEAWSRWHPDTRPVMRA